MTCCWIWMNSATATSWPMPPWWLAVFTYEHTALCLWPAGECKEPGINANVPTYTNFYNLLFLSPLSGFFYSLYSHRLLLQERSGSSGGEQQPMTISLPDTLDPSSISLLLDFMYTSRLPLTLSLVPGVLSAATYLQMDHVADTCREFMQLHRLGIICCY